MCGIVGVFGGRLPSRAASRRALHRLEHRGPDGEGEWQDASVPLWFGHRRLAVLDLSSQGAQPMHSQCGRYVLCFNGEIYNHHALVADLVGRGVALRGHSDTEALLETIAARGLEHTLAASEGMFAFALWDRVRQELSLARDRLGEKPLYYACRGGSLVFASQLSALRAVTSDNGELDSAALGWYFQRGYVPEDACIMRGVRKLRAAEVLSVSQPQLDAPPSPRAYFALDELVRRARAQPFAGDDASAIAHTEELLSRAVLARSVADVPLGALLSGGIDSSLLVALLQRALARPLRTFSVGFELAAYDESSYAREVALHLGCEHTELRVSVAQAREVIPRLPAIYDEPFADSSQIPGILIAAEARRHVTVAISGDGGDEVFAGYLRYGSAQCAWRRLRRLPSALRQLLVRGIQHVPPAWWDAALSARWLPSRWRLPSAGERVHKLARVAAAQDLRALHRAVALLGTDIPLVRRQANPTWPTPAIGDIDDASAWMMLVDSLDYLPGDILTKIDRASMAASLELRAPFLDSALIAFAWSLPMHFKQRDGENKWILRRVLDRHLPPALSARPKAGFAVPLAQWLRGPLREWAGDYLAPDRMRREGLLEIEAVTRLWRDFLAGREQRAHAVWAILMFETWYERWLSAPA